MVPSRLGLDSSNLPQAPLSHCSVGRFPATPGSTSGHHRSPLLPVELQLPSSYQPPETVGRTLIGCVRTRQRMPPPGVLEAFGEEQPPNPPPRVNACSRGAVAPQKQWGYRASPYVTSSQQVDGLLSELAAAHWDSSSYDVKEWISSVGQLLPGQMETLQDHSLRSVALRCARLQARNLRVSFLWMINLIQLVVKCQR